MSYISHMKNVLEMNKSVNIFEGTFPAVSEEQQTGVTRYLYSRD